jgi:hypothetical protein
MRVFLKRERGDEERVGIEEEGRVLGPGTWEWELGIGINRA